MTKNEKYRRMPVFFDTRVVVFLVFDSINITFSIKAE